MCFYEEFRLARSSESERRQGGESGLSNVGWPGLAEGVKESLDLARPLVFQLHEIVGQDADAPGPRARSCRYAVGDRSCLLDQGDHVALLHRTWLDPVWSEVGCRAFIQGQAGVVGHGVLVEIHLAQEGDVVPYDQAMRTRWIGLESSLTDVAIDLPFQSSRSVMEFHAELLRLGAIEGLNLAGFGVYRVVCHGSPGFILPALWRSRRTFVFVRTFYGFIRRSVTVFRALTSQITFDGSERQEFWMNLEERDDHRSGGFEKQTGSCRR